jgi:hypothetical protein
VAAICSSKACQYRVEPDPAEQARRYGDRTAVLDWRDRLRCWRRGGREIDMVVSGTERR